jgi:hypothetical protein
MTCHPTSEIAKAVELDERVIELRIAEIRKNGQMTDSSLFGNFEAEVYQVWNFAKSTNLVKHPCNIPPEILDNLLWYYTKPFDVVFDPFAGGGGRYRWWGGV